VPAPAYAAYANLIRQLAGAAFQKRETTDPHTFIQRFTKDGQAILVCWATEPAHLAFKADQPAVVVDMMGAEQTLTPVNGEISLTLDDAPVFLKGAVSPIEHGRFSIAASQTVDLTDKLRIRYSYNNTRSDRPLEGSLSILGRSFPLTCKANELMSGEAVLSDQDTTASGSRTLRYQWSANGKIAGQGAVTVNVIDPLTIEQDPSLQQGIRSNW